MVNFNEEQKIIIDLAEETPITTEVNDINHIPSYKIAEEERRANEQQRIANENEREKFYNEFQDKVNRGDFDADNGVYVGSEPPTDEDVTVWIDPNGTPEVEAKNIFFTDNENLQTKYENGELKGEKGDKGEDGTMSFSDLTEEQKASLKGDKGDKGDTGEAGTNGKDGADGKDGYTPIKGVDYFTPEDIASLNIPTKLSQLTNDSGFLTSEKQVYSTEEQVIGTWLSKPLYRKIISTTEAIDGTNNLAIAHGVSNWEKMWVDVGHSFYYEEARKRSLSITQNFYTKITSTERSDFYVEGDYVYLVSNGGWGANWEKVITLNYTKTTD